MNLPAAQPEPSTLVICYVLQEPRFISILANVFLPGFCCPPLVLLILDEVVRSVKTLCSSFLSELKYRFWIR